MKRTVWLAATVAITLTATAADAQRVVAHGPGMRMGGAPRGGMPHPGPRPMPHPAPQKQWQGQFQHQAQGQWQRQRTNVRVNVRNRWGGRIGGKWWGGGRAPGGWGAYRRPFRGYVLPSYWISPNWYITNWGDYGLSQPPYGYNWSRYYDDAVLVDGRGSVYDTVNGVDWDGAGYADGGYADDGYADEAYGDGGYGAPGAPYPYPQAGGVPVAPPAPPPPPPHHAPPPPTPGAGYAPPPPPPGAGAPVVVQQGGYYAGGYYYPGATVTTVTVTSTPVVTTTTEVFEDTVTYTRPARRAVHRRTWRPKPKCVCR